MEVPLESVENNHSYLIISYLSYDLFYDELNVFIIFILFIYIFNHISYLLNVLILSLILLYLSVELFCQLSPSHFSQLSHGFTHLGINALLQRLASLSAS